MTAMLDAHKAPADAPEVLFLGETRQDRYVEGVLSTAFRVTKLHSGQPHEGSEAERRLGDYALIVLSDYPCRHLSAAHQESIRAAVQYIGHGLLMVGGWATFGGPRGGYHGATIAELLPVELSAGDDRVNTPLGTVLVARDEQHSAIMSVQREAPCVVVGYNAVRRRSAAATLIDGYTLGMEAELRPSLEKSITPMLSVWDYGSGRVAAFAPDFDASLCWRSGGLGRAPHQAADWHGQRIRLTPGH